MSRIWVGTDCGKSHHHCLVMDTDGDTLLSRRVPNDEPELLELIGDVLDIASGDQATWAMDMTGGEPALLIELLLNHGQELVYIPGIAVNRATDSYRGVGKTDARDAKVIADQARMRRDLQPIRPADEAAIELRLLTEHRSDLVADRTRTVNRLKSLLTGMFPALERAFDMGTTGALVLLTGYQTPVAIRRAGKRRLATWLRNRKVRTPDAVAAKALDAADRQHTAVAGEKAIARMVHTLAKEVMTLNEKIAETDQLIEGRFREHELAEVIASMPGIGPILGAEFLAATGGSLDAFPTADRLATFAGVAPAPKDSGQISENHHLSAYSLKWLWQDFRSRRSPR
ncbi:IS110 family transposase [Streptomyces sp. NBC_01549]|uniref:IS110 family transposase n=1 Tax=unclassified Streptomyces TaxID=2593676 RepID=UPI00224D9017|nr:IS110 family transposase [Streptomyces sp. NBC_01549]MCX4597493.1 IS110 family transposase [Streptomyces sp. NBC_01549]